MAESNSVKITKLCTCVEKCSQIQRTIDALNTYQSLDFTRNDAEDILIKYCSETYKYLIDDYNHILLKHNDDMDTIYKMIQSNDLLSSCTFETCSSYQSSNRNRESDTINDTKQNLQFIFWKDLLDQIHCFMIHLFDSGIRIKQNTNKNDDTTTDIATSNIPSTRYKSKKFNINMNEGNNKEQKIDNENDQLLLDEYDEKNANKETCNNSSSCFSIGYTFYYWQYYKNNNIKHDYFNGNDHLGYTVSELFIHKKYNNLQDELLNNKIQT
eukprot:383122_1